MKNPKREIHHVEKMSRIALEKATMVFSIYMWSGADVSTQLETDGTVTFFATFYKGGKYPTSGMPNA